VEGIVLTGGCALNVLLNQRIYDSLPEGGNGNGGASRMYVPPAPNDAGLVVGAVWAISPPLAQQTLQYLGFRLFDLEALDETARRRGAHNLTQLGGVEYLAELLAGGSAWIQEPNRKEATPIIAVVRGRQEFGPRALGHRSLLAAPISSNMRDRLNRLKDRRWYRPVAPMVSEEALRQVFGRRVKSPYMTMAPRVLEDVRARYPALAHVDGTARHQSVGEEDEPWVHSLLLAVGRQTGLAALINTSFNSKGQPIVNRISECLEMLDELMDLDYVLIEDWLFRKSSRRLRDG
jgi:carbamoyltransferase